MTWNNKEPSITFTFDPRLHHIGLAITQYTLWISLIIIAYEKLPPKLLHTINNWVPKKKSR